MSHIFPEFRKYNLLFSSSRVIYTHAERHRTPTREDKDMITYKTNHASTTKSMTEWYFGKAFVASMTAKAKRENKKNGKIEFRFWQDGTGYLTIQLH